MTIRRKRHTGAIPTPTEWLTVMVLLQTIIPTYRIPR